MIEPWIAMGHLIEMNYGQKVHWRDGYFYCPKCGRAIYQISWNKMDLMNGDNGFICPFCESIIN